MAGVGTPAKKSTYLLCLVRGKQSLDPKTAKQEKKRGTNSGEAVCLCIDMVLKNGQGEFLGGWAVKPMRKGGGTR